MKPILNNGKEKKWIMHWFDHVHFNPIHIGKRNLHDKMLHEIHMITVFDRDKISIHLSTRHFEMSNCTWSSITETHILIIIKKNKIVADT